MHTNEPSKPQHVRELFETETLYTSLLTWPTVPGQYLAVQTHKASNLSWLVGVRLDRNLGTRIHWADVPADVKRSIIKTLGTRRAA